jgi:peptidoglycan/xylan/chitin deacetylase (PgdA/CDA1 family)
MFYFATTPKWVQKLFSASIWDIPQAEKAIYLSFDDGPHPSITPFILDELVKYNAKATFFCIGKNVHKNPIVYDRILAEGHAVGNHTFNHLNGWKTGMTQYLTDVLEAQKHIDSDLFRPPYGHITRNQRRALLGLNKPFKIVMWSVLSGDFDVNISPEKCCTNVIENTKNGSVVVFHDSEKAEERMRHALPIVLKHFSERGYFFKKIELVK